MMRDRLMPPRGLIIGLAANLLEVWLLLPLLSLPAGAHYRDMAALLWTVIIAALALGVGVPMSVLDIMRNRRVAGVIGIILGVSPLPCYLFFSSLIARQHGLVPSP